VRPPAVGGGVWLPGDLHTHSTYSHDVYGGPTDDNTGPDEAYTAGLPVAGKFAEARERQLRFLAVSDHNDVRSVPELNSAAGGLVALPAYEHSIKGHAQMLGARKLYPAGDQAADAVNARWARADWTPVVVDARDDFPRSVAGLERYDVLLVNPIKDGLNLVAKEGPLVNRRDGVLCLSPEAGAFDELGSAAVPVHPYDVEHAAHALHDALVMDAEERAARAARLAELAAARTPRHWLADQIAAASAPS